MALRLKEFQPERIPTIFIGGGTPSLISVEIFSRFLTTLFELTGPVDEFSVEMNPESLTAEFIQAIRTHNQAQTCRISLGVQSYNNKLLTWLGRPAGKETIYHADELLRTYWTGYVSRDILAALPRQPDGLIQDLERSLAYRSGHVSLYELTVESGTPAGPRFQSPAGTS